MRLFTAIEISNEARRHLQGVQTYLQSDWMDADGMDRIKWVEPSNLHITLKFLGEVADAHVDELKLALASVAVDPMELFTDRFERFPSKGPARVLAGGVGGDAGRVELLFRQIEEICQAHGTLRERRKFIPHATLGRSREGLSVIGSAMGDADLRRFWPGPRFTVRSFVLMKSTLTPERPIYEVLHSYE
jgi:2'-5' RNA ligase